MSLGKALGQREFEQIKESCDLKWISDKKRFILTEYTDNGIRLEFESVNDKCKKYDPEHRAVNCILTLNMYKLLYPGECLGAVTSDEEIIGCVNNLIKVMVAIYKKSGIDLWHDMKVKRVDVTHDIIVPNDLYAHEIINLAKKSLRKVGYKVWSPSECDEKNSEWEDENATFFYSHAKEVEGKVYDKKADLLLQGIADPETERGLVRFELTLKRKFLRDYAYICDKVETYEDFARSIQKITSDAKELLLEYIADSHRDGSHFSEEMLKKYIGKKLFGKFSRKVKMLEFINFVNARNSDGRVFGSWKEIHAVETHFEKIKTSPVFINRRTPYIPSFHDLITDQVDEEQFGFVRRECRTRKLVLWK